MARPTKIKWPLSFSGMLRYAFKDKRPEDRLGFYRLFLRDFIHKGTTLKASPTEIEVALAADQQKTFDENWTHHIRMWSHGSYASWKAESYRERAKKMATASWSPEARKNRKKRKMAKNTP